MQAGFLEFDFLQGKDFSLHPGWLWGPIQWVPGAISPGVKQLGHEADHSPQFSAEVKNDGAVLPPHHMSS
jgi:hypothetical protein